jgi:hypothetical protein
MWECGWGDVVVWGCGWRDVGAEEVGCGFVRIWGWEMWGCGDADLVLWFNYNVGFVLAT